MPEPQGSEPLSGILAEIVRTKRRELAALVPRAEALAEAAERAPAPRDFGGALRVGDRVAVVAECKRRSPGAGEIRPDLDPAALAFCYARAGAGALSVLTDVSYFGGSQADLAAARAACTLPVLRKDFTLDPLHVVEARAAGADAVLLVVRLLDDEVLRRLQAEARAWGMAALVEVHDRRELARALDTGAEIVGINNRDLATFRTDLGTTLELIEEVPDGVSVVSESGIRTRADVDRLAAAGVDGILVGETFLRAPDPEEVVRLLASVPRRERVRG